jgi:hypothetical protein
MPFFIMLHNMIVKQCKRIVKYAKRGFEIVDINVIDKLYCDEQSSLSTTCTDSDDEQSTSSSQSTDSDLQEANTLKCNVASNVHQGSPGRRVKVLHNDRLSHPAKRAKMRCIDKGGVETNSFCCL